MTSSESKSIKPGYSAVTLNTYQQWVAQVDTGHIWLDCGPFHCITKMLVIKIYLKFLLGLVFFAVWIIYIESVILKTVPLCKHNGCYTTLGDCYTLFIWCSSLRVVLLRKPKILFFSLSMGLRCYEPIFSLVIF